MSRKVIRPSDIWDCASPTYGHNLCVDSNTTKIKRAQEDEESPRRGGHFHYPTPRAYNQPPVAVVIPPGNAEYPTINEYRRARNTPSRIPIRKKKEKRSTFASDITVATHQDRISTELSDEGSYDSMCNGKRRFWLLLASMLVLVAGIFSVGLGVGLGVRGKNKSAENGGSDDSKNKARNATDILVGAYYYPWYGSNFHNGDGYVRSQLDPPQYPTLGEYDDSKPETISQHLKWSRQANIGLWITSWWGPNRLEDSNTKNIIMEHKELGDLKIALHYETTGRVRDGDMETVELDIKYMCDNYFNHKSYYTIDGRPAIFVYVSRKLEQDGLLEETILMMRSTANRCGKNIFIVGDHVFSSAPDADPGDTPINAFFYFDAVTNYDMYGSMASKMLHAGSTDVTDYYAEQKAWKDLAATQGCHYMPTVSPGFNDRGVRLRADHQPLSRRLTPDSVEGSLFKLAVDHATRLVDPTIDNLLLVNSFNEWHEDTQIEPCRGPTTSSPEFLTEGLDYEGYGELYLNILREGTKPKKNLDEDNIFQQGGN